MAVDLSSLNVQLQRFLKTEGRYKKGNLDGVFGADMLEATVDLLYEYGVDNAGWSRKRRYIALKQLFYKSLKIYSGAIDGFEGHLTQYANEVYDAKMLTTFRDVVDETVKQLPKPVVVSKPKTTTQPVTKIKWPTQSGVSSFYGGVGKNQVDLILPYEMVLAWDVKTKIKKFSCHKLVKESMERVFQRTLDFYGYEKIKELHLHYWGGCLNVRRMRGGSSWSMHAWGIAVDMDPDRNPFRGSWKNAAFSKPEYNKWNEFWYDEGAINLGKEAGYDSMHYQFARLR